MRMPIAILAALTALSACNQKPDDAQNQAANAAANAEEQGQANATPPAGSNPLPADTGALRFVGNWAAEPDMCGDAPWSFTERGLETAGHVSCTFDRINPVPGGYDIASSCTAEAEEQKDTVRLRFVESTQTMSVSTDTSLNDVSLVNCGA